MQRYLAKRHLLSSGTAPAQTLPDAHQNLVSGHSRCCSLPVSWNSTDGLWAGLESWQQEASPAPPLLPDRICSGFPRRDVAGASSRLEPFCRPTRDPGEPPELPREVVGLSQLSLLQRLPPPASQSSRRLISSPPFAQLHSCTLWPHGVTAARAREAPLVPKASPGKGGGRSWGLPSSFTPAFRSATCQAGWPLHQLPPCCSQTS